MSCACVPGAHPLLLGPKLKGLTPTSGFGLSPCVWEDPVLHAPFSEIMRILRTSAPSKDIHKRELQIPLETDMRGEKNGPRLKIGLNTILNKVRSFASNTKLEQETRKRRAR